MKRKDYQKPTMQVVQLKHRTHILQASELGNPDDYKNGGDPLSL
jgi:hypothetical protein